MLKRVLTACAAVGVLAAVAAPAAAQPYGYGQGYGQNYGQGQGYNQNGYNQFERRLDRLEQRLERGIQNGQITRREAFRVRQDIRQLQIIENRYARNGISRYEAQDLENRLNILQQRIRYERRDGEDRGDYRGYDDDRRDDYRRY